MWLLGLWLFPPGAFAQPVGDALTPDSDSVSSPVPPDTAATLRLPDLLATAARANPRLQAARLRADALATRRAQVQPLPDPVVGSTYFAAPVATARGEQRTQWRVQQSIPVPGTRRLQRTVADLETDAARADADALAQTLAVEIRRAYYTLYRVQEQTRLIRRFQSDLSQFEEAALAQYEVGSEGQPAVLKAQIERQRLDLRLDDLAAERASTLQRLTRLTGRSLPDDASAVRPSTASPSEDGDRGPLGPSDVDAQRPEAEALRADIDRAGRQIDLARRDTWPDVTVGLQYIDVADAGPAPSTDGRDAVAVSVGLALPLWRGARNAQIEEARTDRRRAKAQLDAFELEVRTRLRDLRTRIDRQQSQLRRLDTLLLPKAETALASTLSSYQTGAGDFLDLLDAQRTLFQLRLDRIARFSLLLSTRAEFERAAGRIALAPSTPRTSGPRD